MGCTLRDEGTILAGRCDGRYKVFGDLDDVLVELIQSGEHPEMAMALVTTSQWSSELNFLLKNLLQCCVSRCPAMERIVERVEPHHIRSVFETAITRTKTLWVVDHVLAHVEIPEWEVLRFVEVLINDRGSEYWKDAIHRLCNRPLGSSSTYVLKKLAKYGLMDEAKVLIRANLDDENKWWLATRSLAMLRVAFSGYIDELRVEVVLLAGKSLPDYVDEVLDVALKHGLHEVTPLLAETHPSCSELLRKSLGQN